VSKAKLNVKLYGLLENLSRRMKEYADSQEAEARYLRKVNGELRREMSLQLNRDLKRKG
jgi:hypothetical protein